MIIITGKTKYIDNGQDVTQQIYQLEGVCGKSIVIM